MRRLTYYWRLLDRRDRVVVAGLALGALGTAWGVGYTTAAHQARVVRAKDCVERVEAKARARGYQLVRVAALVPCEVGR